MSVYKIDKDVPYHGKIQQKYPYQLMEVGDSFFVPTRKEGYVAIAACRKSAKGTDKEFSSRKELEGNRIWRIK